MKRSSKLCICEFEQTPPTVTRSVAGISLCREEERRKIHLSDRATPMADALFAIDI